MLITENIHQDNESTPDFGLNYNTELAKMILPEYGRNIHNMVAHCMTIEDREERNRCAYTIVRVMANMFPEIRHEADYRRKLWDHLAIMSDFQLDVDYPFEVVEKDRFAAKPEPVGYQREVIRYRHYGKIVERMIARAAEYPEGEERDALVMLIANHMKKLVCQISSDEVDDAKIFKDLRDYSLGSIRLDPATHRLHDYHIIAPPPTGKKKKKK